MTINSLIALALTFFLALFASWALLLPFFESEEPDSTSGEGERDDLVLKRDFALDALEDLETDFHARKITEVEYQEAKGELVSEAGVILAELDRLAAAERNAPPEDKVVKPLKPKQQGAAK